MYLPVQDESNQLFDHELRQVALPFLGRRPGQSDRAAGA
jgi:hypothetical protein